MGAITIRLSNSITLIRIGRKSASAVAVVMRRLSNSAHDVRFNSKVPHPNRCVKSENLVSVVRSIGWRVRV
jgi:hypothetical protein